jgi:IS5 family transposase
VKRTEFERVIVGTTGPEKAVSHPWDARLLEAAREKPVRLAERAGIALKMTYDREGTVLRRQSKIPGALIREITRKLGTVSEQARAKLAPWLQRA